MTSTCDQAIFYQMCLHFYYSAQKLNCQDSFCRLNRSKIASFLLAEMESQKSSRFSLCLTDSWLASIIFLTWRCMREQLGDLCSLDKEVRRFEEPLSYSALSLPTRFCFGAKIHGYCLIRIASEEMPL